MTWSSPNAKLLSFGLDFNQERERCLRRGTLFEDPEFPAKSWTIFFAPHSNLARTVSDLLLMQKDAEIVWLRPKDIVKEPQFFTTDKLDFNVVQGILGDCWFLASVANLAERPELFYRVVPPDQSFTDKYAGIFHFQFYRYGEWVDVVIDDRLPVIQKGETRKLLFLRPVVDHEFWSPLLEKAYAKLYGSYESLEGGLASEALEDLTGGIAEYHPMEKCSKEALVALMLRCLQKNSFIGCGTRERLCEAEFSRKKNGIMLEHSYIVTALHQVNVTYGSVLLIRVRNPAGHFAWNGAWSAKSDEWTMVPQNEIRRLQPQCLRDGEFWMCIDDFRKEFTDVEVCHCGAELMTNDPDGMIGDDSATTSCGTAIVHGCWSKQAHTTGGCERNSGKAWNF